MDNIYYRMARESGKFSISQMREVAYLAQLNRHTWLVWQYKNPVGQWTIALAA